MKSGTDMHAPLRMNCNSLDNPLIFHILVYNLQTNDLPVSAAFVFIANYLMLAREQSKMKW